MFAVTLVVYLAAGTAYWLAGGDPSEESLVRAGRLVGLFQRPENGLYIGFDRPPLPSLVMAPFTLLPAFGGVSFAAGLSAAIGAALSVTLLNYCLSRAESAEAWRGLLLFGMAMNPLVLLAVGAGSSDTWVIAMQVAVIGATGAWLRNHRSAWLMATGFSLGVAALTDTRFLVDALLFVPFVAVRTFRHLRSGRMEAEAIAFILPFGFVLGFWVIVCWIAANNPMIWLQGPIDMAMSPSGIAALGADIAGLLFVTGAIHGHRTATWQFGLGTVLIAVLLAGCQTGVFESRVALMCLVPLVLLGSIVLSMMPYSTRWFAACVGALVVACSVPGALRNDEYWSSFVGRLGNQPSRWQGMRAAAKLVDTATAKRTTLVDGDVGDIVMAFVDRPDRVVTPRDPEFDRLNTSPGGAIELIVIGPDAGPITERHPELRRRDPSWASVELDREGIRVFRLNEPLRSNR